MPQTGGTLWGRVKESWICFPRAAREFFRNSGIDGAAALSFYMVLALFPGLLALISLLTLLGASYSGTEWILNIFHLTLAPNGEPLSDDAQQLMDTAEQLLITLTDHAGGTSLAIILGTLGALWSTSAYVAAFGRAMNRLFSAPEGRPQWKRRPQMYLITIVIAVLAMVGMGLMLTTGDLARAIGNFVGLGENFATVYNWSKPLVLLVIFLLVLALLYYFTPNVKRPTFQWFSPGTVTAMVVLALSVLGFSVYLNRFATFSATYGAIGGIIILVAACWVGNIALIFGALVDIEFIRLRQLRTGMPAAEDVQLPLRDDTLVAKRSLAKYKDLVQAQEIRLHHGGDPLQDMSLDPAQKAKKKTKYLPIALAALGVWILMKMRGRISRSNRRNQLQDATQRQPDGAETHRQHRQQP